MGADQKKTEQSTYQIVVQGNLDPKWADWFEGFSMSSRIDGETLLIGEAVDQASLHGALAKVHGLGLTLLMVLRIVDGHNAKGCRGYEGKEWSCCND